MTHSPSQSRLRFCVLPKQRPELQTIGLSERPAWSCGLGCAAGTVALALWAEPSCQCRRQAGGCHTPEPQHQLFQGLETIFVIWEGYFANTTLEH